MRLNFGIFLLIGEKVFVLPIFRVLFFLSLYLFDEYLIEIILQGNKCTHSQRDHQSENVFSVWLEKFMFDLIALKLINFNFR